MFIEIAENFWIDSLAVDSIELKNNYVYDRDSDSRKNIPFVRLQVNQLVVDLDPAITIAQVLDVIERANDTNLTWVRGLRLKRQLRYLAENPMQGASDG